MTNLTAAKIRKYLALAASELSLDNLEAAATAARTAGALNYKTSKLVCDLEIVGESPAVVEFLMSYAVEGWTAARAEAAS